jgi:hypothetical protein
MMHQFDNMNLSYMRQGLSSATSAKDQQMWLSRVITATNTAKRRGGEYTMDMFTKSWGDLEAAKQTAAAAGRYAEYHNLVVQQANLARFILGGTLDVSASTNPYLTADQKARIARDLAAAAPRQPDATDPETYNPTGDVILQMIKEGDIQVEYDSEKVAVKSTLDPFAGYRTQRSDGVVETVRVDRSDETTKVYDEAMLQNVPVYTKANSHAVVHVAGQDIDVWQPIGETSIPVYHSTTGAASSPSAGFGQGRLVSQIPGQSLHVEPYHEANGAVTLPLGEFSTREGGRTTHWVSLDRQHWVGYQDGDTAPRIVIGSEYTWDAKAKQWLKGGAAVDAAEVQKSAHWWTNDDSRASGAAWGQGAPLRNYQTVDARADGRIDTRSNASLVSGKREAIFTYGTEDRAVIRESYFTDTQAAASLAESRRQDKLAEVGRHPEGALRPQDIPYRPSDQWAGDLLPKHLRAVNQGLVPAVTSTPVTTSGGLVGNIGLGRRPDRLPLDDVPIGQPAPTLRPAPTADLAPVANFGDRAEISLRPITQPVLTPIKKQTYGGNTGKAGRDRAAASRQAAERKAAAKRAADQARADAATKTKSVPHQVAPE